MPNSSTPSRSPRVLLYTRSDVPHHPSIAVGIQALLEIAAAGQFSLTQTEDPAVFTGAGAGRPDVVVFLNTATDELNDAQREGFMRLIRSGSAFVGIHSATFFERDWPWFERLVGARFAGHPEPQEGRVLVTDRDHPATRDLPSRWVHLDEWYNFRTLPSGVRVLASVDESTYSGGAHGTFHPVMWCHVYEGSRSIYTALGHTEECFRDEIYLRHLAGAIRWAARMDE